jgi:hypothetical protein
MTTPLRFLLATIEEQACDHEECTEKPHTIAVTVWRAAEGGPALRYDDLAPGDTWIDPWSLRAQEREGKHSCPWSNCDGRHVWVVLPNGAGGKREWSPDARAANCTLPEDREHRCWCRHGAGAALHVDKVGRTCAAGAGSIALPQWHGYVHNGQITP